MVRVSLSNKDVPSERRSAPLEKVISGKLAYREHGQVEVKTQAGIVDVLTKDEIIEVKFYREYKKAIGQALCYQLFLPHKKARIHLFGIASTEYKLHIGFICKKLNVRLTWEGEPLIHLGAEVE